MTFTTNVSNLDSDAKVTYNWTVSAGTIVSGQGTSSITVDSTGIWDGTIEATIEVNGLPDSCGKKTSCSTTVVGIGDPGRLDEYGNIRWSDERARLDNFAIEMQNDPSARGYIICYGGRVGRAGEALRRCSRAKSYVNRHRGIEAARIVTIDGGYKEELAVELFIVPSGATPPMASPTVDPKEVRIIKRGAKSRRLH
ncbi:MAG TPA: hypothetical protein VFA21_00380 [Pyrinomonadaceae bacterium]|nr:hypothetical protein [Pyrinomonadaceae bacterium]